MAGLLSNPHVQGQVIDGLPEEAIRRVPDVIKKKNNDPTDSSLLSQAGWSAGATAAFNAKPVYDGRNTAKGFLNMKKVSKGVSAMRVAKNLGVGALAGTAVTLPTEYLVGKASEKYQNDDQFHAGHFAAIAAPAAISGTLGTGAFMNTMDQMRNAGKLGTKQMAKNIVSPKKIVNATGREFKNMGTMFKTRKYGTGLLAAGMMGLSAIEPLMYMNQTMKKKSKDKELKKTAASKHMISNKAIGLGILAGGGYVGVKSFINDKRKKVSDYKRSRKHIKKEIFGEPGLMI